MNYITTFLFSFFISFLLTPICRLIAVSLKIFDYPVSEIKTHKTPVPYLGGLAIAISFYLTLFLVRITTHFPTGTLYSLRGIIFGGLIIIIIGLIDDFKYKGIHFTTKFLGEILAALILIHYGIKINFISPSWFALAITLIWVVGITNAFNLVDVMDGLSSGITIIASLGLFFVTKYIEEEIYVSYAVLSLAGACLGFIPYNLSNKYKIFMGDTGALFLGFVLSALTVGGKYSSNNHLGVLSPIIILLIPIYETFLISILRLSRGQSPFIGSKDHFSLRLLSIGLPKHKVLLVTYTIAIFLNIIGILIVLSKNLYLPIGLILVLALFILLTTKYLVKIEVK